MKDIPIKITHHLNEDKQKIYRLYVREIFWDAPAIAWNDRATAKKVIMAETSKQLDKSLHALNKYIKRH